MPDYRRAHVPGGTYFFTANTYARQHDRDVLARRQPEFFTLTELRRAPGGPGARGAVIPLPRPGTAPETRPT